MNKNPDILLTAKVNIQAARSTDKPARIEILAYGGGPIKVPGWDRFIVIDLSGLELPTSVPLLADHENLIGSMAGEGKPVSDGKQLTVTGVISRSTDAGIQVLNLSREGLSLQASVGVTPEKTEYVSKGTVNINGRKIAVPDGGITIVRKGILKEVSLTPAGADSGTRVNIAAKSGERNMDKKTDAEIRAAERSRLDAIGQLCDGVKGDNVATLKASAVAEEITIEELKGELLTAIKAQAELSAVRTRPDAPAVHAKGGKPVADRDVLACAYLIHSGKRDVAGRQFSENVCAKAESLGVRHIADIAAMALELEGKHAPTTTDGVIRAGFSTVSLPYAIGAGIDKCALDAYLSAPSVWRAFCKVIPAQNFREGRALRPSFNREFEKVGESGELKHGTVGELTIAFQLATYGQMLTLTRQALINDDAGLLTDTADALGRAGARCISDLVAEVLMANADSHFSGANVVTDALSVAGFGAAVTKMRTRRNSDGRDLDLVPRTLLVPPELESTGAQILADEALARHTADGTDSVPTANPYAKAVELATDSRLSNTTRFDSASLTNWYLLASVTDAPMVITFLNGVDRPTIEAEDAPFATLGKSWRGFLDVGVGLGDPVAAIKSTA